jgi:hypothetical protein
VVGAFRAALSIAEIYVNDNSLDSVRCGRLETRRLFYLLTPAAGAERP